MMSQVVEVAAPLVRWRSVAVYLALAFGMSWAIWMGLRLVGVPFLIRALLGLYGPALAAAVVRWWTHEGFADAGLRLAAPGRPGVWRLYLTAYLLVPLLLVAGLGLALLLGIQQWVLARDVHALVDSVTGHRVQPPMGISPSGLVRLGLIAGTLGLFTVAIPIVMLATFGEEFGWRGYLLPRLVPLGEVRAALLTGLIWGLWHAPVVALDGFDYGFAYPGYPLAGIGLLVVFTSAYGVIFAWLRFRSGSVWPSTLAHAALNSQATVIAFLLAGGSALLAAPVGLLGILPPAAVALWLVASERVRYGVPRP
jgi:membrane protease YdiL (CAAX protease family)